MRTYSDLDEAHERVTVTFEGKLTLYDIAEMLTTSGKARVLHFPLLADVSRAHIELSEPDLARFQELVCRMANQSRLGETAVLLSCREDLEMVERLSRLTANFCEVRGFLDREEAERWLGWSAGAERELQRVA